MSVWTGSLITLLIMALFIGNLSRLLGLLRVPDNIRQPAHNYLLILMFGLVATALYNICSGILRAMGDSQTPLRAMMELLPLILSWTLSLSWYFTGAWRAQRWELCWPRYVQAPSAFGSLRSTVSGI